MPHETENQLRLRRAKEALAGYREAESQARKALNQAIEATKRMKERYEELFQQEERTQYELRKNRQL